MKWKEVYDSRAYFEAVDKDFGERIRYFGLLATALVQRFHPRSALDVGCERGFIVNALRETGIEAVGIDISRYALVRGVGKSRGYLCEALADSHSLPFKDGSFDLVTSHYVIEHLENPSRFIQDTRRVLRSGGVAFIVTNIPPLGVVKPWRLLRLQRDKTHISLYSRAFWRESFERFGFKFIGDLDEIIVRQDTPVFWLGRKLFKVGCPGRCLADSLSKIIRGSFLFQKIA